MNLEKHSFQNCKKKSDLKWS